MTMVPRKRAPKQAPEKSEKKSSKRGTQVNFYADPAEVRLWKDMAERAGVKSFSLWIRRALNTAALAELSGTFSEVEEIEEPRLTKFYNKSI